MSAPEDSNRKAPPSLLSDPGQKGGQNASRILANLEGRVSPQQGTESAKPSSRSRKGPLALIVLAIVAVAGWGAWRIQAHQGAAPAVTAAASASAVSGASAASAPAAVAAASSAASGAASASDAQLAQAASTPQTATIVNDEPSRADADAGGTPGNRLSQALANGATDSNTTGGAALAGAGAAATVAAATVAGKADASKHDAVSDKPKTKAEKLAEAKREKQDKQQERQELAAKKRHDRQLEAAAKRHPATASTHHDDPDADLLAALVARTKPADPGPPPSAKPKKAAATKVAANEPTLAARVKECGQRGFFEDQLCRWRVCDGHWGKDPACPSSANQNRQP
ncbi:phage tail protein [Burkholderia plantarii]|uniref:phage tail protein n=1 Tax=Burkholderia plantarii TaxID=41899 RepID=UPI0018DCCE88|nr:phage tail protein [Burkholderia plantarii]MBI0326490.1 phage tail protein [Burkholderia plantarii]